MTSENRPTSGARATVLRYCALALGLTALIDSAWAGGSPSPLSPAWFAARAAGGSQVGSSPSASAAATQLQSMQNVQRSLQSLKAASAALQKAQAAQTAATASTASVPNGLTIGGLQPATTAWQNATLQPQTISNGQTQVTIKQTAPAAVLNWTTFNVGSKTTVNFDQSAGGASASGWAALNRITDPSGNPSQILGNINAQGQVYIINPNGIIFGAGSQINLHALIASSASFTDAQFLSAASGASSGGLYGTTPTFTGATAPIIVQPGATITTAAPASATSGGGFVLLFGASVQNGGAISTPDGQTVLAAGSNFILQPGYSVTGISSAGLPTGPNTTATVVGSEVAPVGAGSATNTGLITATTGDITLAASTVTQAGVLLATTSVNQRGTIHLLTDLAPSSSAASGYVLDPNASVVLAPGAATLVLNDTSGATALASQRAAALSASLAANALYASDQSNATLPPLQYVRLPDMQNQSRIEITSGGSVDFQAGSLTMATGGQIATSAGTGSATPNAGRIFVEPGAVLDVSGSLAAVLPITANAISVQIEGFELRDDPLNRDTNAINNDTVTVDARQLVTVAASASNSATATDGYSQTRDYTSGGLLEVSGELGNVGHTIDEFTASGGSLTLAAPLVVTQPGSVVNIAGGAITYQAGAMPQSWLIGSNGLLYNVNTAPSTLSYVGIYDGQTFSQPRWNVSQTFLNPLIAPSSIEEPGYIVGRDAGSFTVSAATAVLAGSIDAGIVTGPYQNAARTSGVSDPFLQPQNAVPLGGTLALGTVGTIALSGTASGLEVLPNATTVTISNDTVTLGIADAVPASLLGTTSLAADSLNAAQLGALSISASGGIAIDAPLTLGAGAAVTLTAPTTLIGANLTARGGSLTVTDTLTLGSTDTANPLLTGTTATAALTQNEILAAGVTIDTRGLWTNALLDPTDLAGEAYINGGAVSFTSTKGIALATGSLIDASAGGAIASTGTTLPGTGGAISIDADTYTSANISSSATGAADPVTLSGTVRSLSGTNCATAGGCGFSLTAPSIAIGDALSPAIPGQVILPSALFTSGFLSYSLNGTATGLSTASVPGVSVAPGTQLKILAPTEQFTQASQSVPTGSDPASALRTGLLPLYLPNPQTATVQQRPSASLTLASDITLPGNPQHQGGAVVIGSNAAISVDPGASVSLKAVGAILVAGSITAPGGTISLINDTYQAQSTTALTYVPGQMILVAAGATLSTAAQAYTALDLAGRPFGTVPAGGSILIGGPDVLPNSAATVNQATDAFVVIEPGTVLDASGTSARIDPAAGLGPGRVASLGTAAGARSVPSAGGTIALNSETGLILDGSLTARAGGAGAAGGTLSITAETPDYQLGVGQVAAIATENYAIPDALRTGRDLILQAQYQTSGLTASALANPATAAAALTPLIGQTVIGADRIAAGGFGTVNLSTQDALIFNGPVSLSAGQSISLTAGAFGVPAGAKAAAVALAAPYVSLSGTGGQAIYSSTDPAAAVSSAKYADTQTGALYNAGAYYTPSSQTPTASLSISAGLIDISGFPAFGQQGAVGLGSSALVSGGNTVASANIQQAGTPSGGIRATDLADFATISLVSQSDIRFLAPAAGGVTTLLTAGNITLQAQQIYPASQASAQIIAGAARVDIANSAGAPVPTLVEQPAGLITILGNGAAPALPQVAAGSLTFVANTILQGGVVVAPLGTLQLGATTGTEVGSFTAGTVPSFTAQGSYTIATGDSGQIKLQSAATQTPLTSSVVLLPGSVTSVSANGLTIAAGGTTDGTTYTGGLSLAAPPQIILAGSAINEQAGARLDLSGGGTLAGIGFITGAGGSVDTLATPNLTLANAGKQTTDPVYAIVVGPQPMAAQPSLEGYATPGLGQQITIEAGIPGLPAGTYTLLPADNALRPGGFRVELTAARTLLPAPVLSGKNTYLADVTTGTAGTHVASVLPVVASITPAAQVRDDSQYDEETFSQFVTAQAALQGLTRTGLGPLAASGGYAAVLPADGGILTLSFLEPAGAPLTAALQVAGTTSFTAAAGGYGGAAVVVVDANDSLEITPQPNAPVASGTTLALDAPSLNRLGASVLQLGGTLDAGATLAAPEIVFTGSALNGALSTIGQTGALENSTGGVTFALSGDLVASNALLLPSVAQTSPTNTLVIGPNASLAAGGSLVFSAGSLTLPTTAQYGAANIQLATSNLIIGTAPALAAAGNSVPAGIVLTADSFAALLSGNRPAGAPPLQSLTVTATNEVAIYGAVTLATAALQQFEINSPSIQGYGTGPADLATITAGTFVWNGLGNVFTNATASAAAPAPGAGSGQGGLRIAANTIILGYGDGEVPANQYLSLDRVLYGFSNVTLAASQAIIARDQGSLILYQTATPASGTGYAGTGGSLTLDTPLLTAADAALLKMTAGGPISILSSTAGAADLALAGQGGEIDLTAPAISVATTIAAPAGKLSLLASSGDITLAPTASLDLAGVTTPLFDETLSSPGGSLVLESTSGNITAAAGARIDVSAQAAAAGSIAATATSGTVALDATLLGSSQSSTGGSLTLRTGTLSQPEFDALQTALNAGGFIDIRAIEIATGNIAVTGGAGAPNQLRASTVSLSADSGTISVSGVIDASGATPGAISLAAGGNLSIAAGAVLDAHGTVLQTDSTGAAIDAENQANIQLTLATGNPGSPGTGVLSIASGAVLDVSSPQTLTATGIAPGVLTLSVPRLLSAGSETGTLPLQIGNITLRGAGSVVIDAFRAYAPTSSTAIVNEAGVSTTTPTLAPSDLDTWNTDSQSFIRLAEPNGALNTTLAASLGALATLSGLHLRPGIAVVTPGDLVISGDLNLASYRYASLDPANALTSVYGSGEPGALQIRAGGSLTINGSITDGFALPTDGTGSTRNPDDNGWILTTQSSALLGSVTLPASVGAITLGGSDTGTATTTTSFANSGSLNYAITIDQNTILADTTLPTAVTLGNAITLPAGTTITANVTTAAGSTVLAAGTTLSASQTIPAGDILAKGFVTPVAVTTLGQGTPIAAGTKLTSNTTVPFTTLTKTTSYTVPAGYSISIVRTTGTTTTTVTYKAGQSIPASIATSGNITLAAGDVLPFTIALPINQGQLWPAGASLADFANPVVLESPVTLGPGDIIPANTTLFASNGTALTLNLRPTTNGVQGAIYADAAPLPQGSLSWSIDLAAGANLAAADPLALQPVSALGGTGNLVLNDPHVGLPAGSTPQISFSVIRTGTGTLNLVAGGNFVEDTLYGIYTAGSAVSSVPASAALVSDASSSALTAAGYSAAAAGAQAFRATGGGNLTISVQGSLSGDIYDDATSSSSANGPTAPNNSAAIGQWLWRDGGSDLDQAAGWAINTGTYVPSYVAGTASGPLVLAGFTGFGTLGGGNVTITSGGDAGEVSAPASILSTTGTAIATRSGGLAVAIASGSYVDANGTRQTTGGGALTVTIGGALNPLGTTATSLAGSFTDLRGTATISAGAIGGLTGLNFGVQSGTAGTTDTGLPASGIYVPTATALDYATPEGGPAIVPGDAQFTILTRGNLVLAGVGDATRVVQDAAPDGTTQASSWFTLWTGATSLSLAAAGGNISPVSNDSHNEYINVAFNDDPPAGTTGGFEMPAQLSITANTGSYLQLLSGTNSAAITLAPAATGQLDLLAGGAIYGADIALSGATPSVLASPANPADAIETAAGSLTSNIDLQQSNTKPALPGANQFPLVAFGPDTATPSLHANDNTPVHVYAAGDIVDTSIGRQITQTGNYYPAGSTIALANPTLTLAAKPVWLRAGGDIVNLGSAETLLTQSLSPSTTLTPGTTLLLNTSATSLSLVQAGRDIVQANIDIAGPGTLEVSAGRELYQAGSSNILSTGAITPGSLASGQGAAIDILAGIGAGLDTSEFANLYFNPANLANANTPLQDQPGKVLVTYQDALLAFLQSRGDQTSPQGALAAFAALDPAIQTPLLLSVLFDELTASGQAAANPASRFYKSYLQGNQALTTLFPAAHAYSGDVTLFGSSGIKTLDGGAVDIVVPGGQTELGVASQPASASSGVLTQGAGNIDIYALNSVLLGQSRVFTTFGGGITIWSAQGDINAGQGAKTTQVFTPPAITYDLLGDITLAPTAPATGAGIATLSPIPGIPPGDVVLVAPLGTIDAGEAGIRSTGNVSLAATVVLNAANVQAGGKTTGIPVIAAPNVAAALGAAATAGSEATTTSTLPSAATTATPTSFITVDVEIGGNTAEDQRKKAKKP